MNGLAGLLGFIFGIGIGGLVGFLVAERRCRRLMAQDQSQRAVAEQRCADLEKQLLADRQACEAARRQASEADQRAAALNAQLKAAQDNLQEQRRLLEDAQQKLREAFAVVSAEAMEKNNQVFLELAKTRFESLATQAAGSLDERKAQIEGLLKPMQELLGTYQTRLGEIEKSRVESYSMLREQLGTMTETQRALNLQTSQLVTALRRPQTRGQWGEITLRRLVELVGMSAHCDFTEQMCVEGHEGRQKPDVIVHLPGERTIVIDCKAVLDAFLDAAGCENEDQRRLYLQRHCQQVRTRVRELSAKSYWAQFKSSPEYVVMFLPGEAFLYAAVEQDGAILEDCLKNHVILATPTTLYGLLKAVEFGWRQDSIARNAEEIRQLGTELYERIATVAEHFRKIGGSLEKAVESYNDAVGSMESRLLVTARKIGELGAKSGKAVPEFEPIDTRTRPLSLDGTG